MLVRIPPEYSVSEVMGFLKGKSSLMIFDRHANLKYKYGNRNICCRGCYVDTVGKNAKKIQVYIQHQLEEDKINDQISLKEYTDPFTGKPADKRKQISRFSGNPRKWCGRRTIQCACKRWPVPAPYRGSSSHRLNRWS